MALNYLPVECFCGADGMQNSLKMSSVLIIINHITLLAIQLMDAITIIISETDHKNMVTQHVAFCKSIC